MRLPVVGLMFAAVVAMLAACGEAEEAAPVAAAPSPAPASAAAPVATEGGSVTQWSAAPEMTIDPTKRYTAIIHTNKGEITLDLFAGETPVAVNNFVFLARQGFYDGVIFHRVIKGFMVQGGDPTGTGTGSPGYRFNDEPITRDYVRGTLAMANSGPNTNGSQFFIMHQNYSLPKSYVIFGLASDGLEVVDTIANIRVGANDRPTETITIERIEIREE